MRRQKLLKISAWIVGVLVILVIAGNIILKSVIEKRLKSSLQQFQPFIQAGFSEAHINLFAASVQLDSVHISINPKLNQQYSHQLYCNTTISGINFFSLITNKNFSAQKLKLSNTNIILDEYLLNQKDTLPAGFLKQIKFPFNKIYIDEVELSKAHFFKQTISDKQTICNADINLTNLQIPKIDSAFTKDSIQLKHVYCRLDDVNYQLNNYYACKVKMLSLNSKDSVLEIDSLKLQPLVGKYALGQRLGKQADHITASVNNIHITGLDVMQLRKKKFTAAGMNIIKPVVYVFRDRRLPRSQQKQPTPLEYLKEIPFDLNVQQFNLNDANVISEEFPKEGEHTGYIELEHLFINMKPLINRTTNGNSVTSYVKTSIMNAGALQATINLSLLSGDSKIKGFISSLHLPAMNPSAENLGRFHIESGLLDRLDFAFTATDVKAEGQIIGVYHDLVINRLKNTKEGLKTAKLPSFLLHKIIIPKNKDASLDVSKRTGKIDYDRDPTRLVTFYYLKALLDGIRDSFALGFVLPK